MCVNHELTQTQEPPCIEQKAEIYIYRQAANSVWSACLLLCWILTKKNANMLTTLKVCEEHCRCSSWIGWKSIIINVYDAVMMFERMFIVHHINQLKSIHLTNIEINSFQTFHKLLYTNVSYATQNTSMSTQLYRIAWATRYSVYIESQPYSYTYTKIL